MKTSELIGPALDWAVAKCEGFTAEWDDVFEDFWLEREQVKHTRLGNYSPSTDWAQGGPIIERKGIDINTSFTFKSWVATSFHGETTCFGPTPLIAALRCYVASNLGDEVNIPEELQNAV